MKKLRQFLLATLSCLSLCQCGSLFSGRGVEQDTSHLEFVGDPDPFSAPDGTGLASEPAPPADFGRPPTDVKVDAKLDAALMVVELDGERRNIVIQLNESAAPQTVLNFKRNVARGYYNGLAFHRVIPRYVVQTGDPLSRDDRNRSNWGTGGPGYTIPGEPGLKHVKGSVAMARLGDTLNPERESSGSQFYICLRDLPKLDGDYTVFGQVLQGLDVLNDLSKVTTNAEDMPVNRIELQTVKLVSSRSRFAQSQSKEKKKDPKTRSDSEKGGFEKLIERFW